MNPWTALPRKQEDQVWERFDSLFRFRPSVSPTEWPAIVEPVPSVTYSLAKGSECTGSREELLERASGLNKAMLDAFRLCTTVDETLYVLDWQHPGFLFQPHADFPAAIWSQWETPVFPDGDYYIFLQRQFRFGTFGHPWEQSLCVFGEPLTKAFDADSVRWLGPIIRIGGGAV